jgi:hypothetical protein
MAGTVPEKTLIDKGAIEGIIASAANAAAKRAVQACALPAILILDFGVGATD